MSKRCASLGTRQAAALLAEEAVKARERWGLVCVGLWVVCGWFVGGFCVAFVSVFVWVCLWSWCFCFFVCVFGSVLGKDMVKHGVFSWFQIEPRHSGHTLTVFIFEELYFLV